MIYKFVEAIIVRAPIAFAIFFVSIKQNTLFNSNQIIIIGSILSSSVLYSILLLQPLGNIFNKMVAKHHSNIITTLTDFRLLIFYLFLFATIFSLIFSYNTNFILAFNLATAQALFQWCISFLTVKNKKAQLFTLCSMLVLELLILVFIFDFQKKSVHNWIFLLILSYYIPSAIFFSFNIKLKLAIKNVQNLLYSFLKLFISSASFYTILAIFFWMLEFYPRITSSFGVYFTSNFNVYMTFSIGLVGAIDTLLNQMYLKNYLELSANDKVGLIKFFNKIIKFNTFLYLLVLLFLIIFNQYYWKYIFDVKRFSDYKIFYFIFFIEIIRILCFHSFNIFFYIDRLDLIRKTIIIISFSTIILFLLTHIITIPGVYYIFIFLLISFFALISNLSKIKKI
jgi:hypothetical protein